MTLNTWRILRKASNSTNAQSGEVPFDEIAKDLEPFGSLNAANKDKSLKTGDITEKLPETVFREGVYVYFPSSRHEIPFWLNEKALELQSARTDEGRFTGTLGKPMVLERGISELKPWMIDLLLDASADATSLVQQLARRVEDKGSGLLQALVVPLKLGVSLQDLNRILRGILLRDNARIVRHHRGTGERRLQIFYGDDLAMPTLDALSAGQGTLLNVFGSTLRFGTQTKATGTAAETEGIVLVDEIDAHLHANLQYDAVPKLMAMFPKVQFIVTCHSPLLPLGMEKQFGSDGYQIIEMPTGSPISAERYSEFQRSLRCSRRQRPSRKRCGGWRSRANPWSSARDRQIPPISAQLLELLGFDDVLEQVEFTWIGDLDLSDKKSSGQGQLKKAVDIYTRRRCRSSGSRSSASSIRSRPRT